MNRAYKLVWNTTQQAWTVVSELARGKTKSSGKRLKVALVLLAGLSAAGVQAAPAANALPAGESVVSGNATFDRSVSNQLTVNQGSSKLISNWSSFNVGSAATVNFVQPDAASIALNRVSGASPTEIFGKVTANGQLVVVNPNGITFGAGSQVSAASIVGSVLDIQDSDFNNGNYLFNRGGATGSIDNQGSLTATAGSVALLAPTVKNSGAIKATGGHISLINANVVNLSAMDPAIITASGINGLIQNTGSLQANKLSNVGGKIVLVNLAGSGNGAMSLSGQLQSGAGVTAQAGVINTGVLSSDNNTLLMAPNVNVNAAFDLNGSASQLSFSSLYRLSSGAKVNLNGANAGLNVAGTAYTIIRNINQLQAINSNLSGKYALAADIDASATSTWNSGAGFVPIGGAGNYFTGVLDGLGHAVNNLHINRPVADNVGLIGWTSSAQLQNIGMLGGSIQGRGNVGALAGVLDYGAVENSFSGTPVSGSGNAVGGLVGLNTGQIWNSHALASVAGAGSVGGLVGASYDGGGLNNNYASGNVTGTSNVGGLVGYSFNTPIIYSYATGSVVGNNSVGGLAGTLDGAQVSFSYASGNVNAPGIGVGGLVGNNSGGSVGNSYWDINTTGKTSAVGVNHFGGTTANLIGVYGNSASTPSAYNQASYANFDFNNTWFIANGNSRPMLRAFLNTADADGKIAINTLYQLQGMAANLAGNYYLSQDIDASATAASVTAGNALNRSDVWGGAGFAPVGNTTIRFTGVLDGLGHVVKNLKIQRTSTTNVGLIGKSNLATIQNIGLSQADIRGNSNVGGLAGDYSGTLRNSFAEGIVTGVNSNVGGLVGFHGSGALEKSYFSGTVSGPAEVGGLAGMSFGNINDSYATGSVIGTGSNVGGLVGWQAGSVSNSYSTASVSGTSRLGGLAGYSRGTIANSYASGAVSGSTDAGGLIGYHDGAFTLNSYWDVNTTGKASAIGTMLAGGSSSNLVAVYGNSASTPSAYNQSSYANLDFNNTWFMADGSSRPMLRAFLNAPDSNGKIAISNLYQLQGMAVNLAGNYYLIQDIDASATAASISAGNANNRSDVWGGRGFAPVGNGSAPFAGQLDGSSHVVSNLNINRNTTNYVGLIGYARNAGIRHIGMQTVNITGYEFVGGLVGTNLADASGTAHISHSYVTGGVRGRSHIGGLLGLNQAMNGSQASVENSYSNASVNASYSIAGGLLGMNFVATNGIATVANSYATGSVSSADVAGGLLGINSAYNIGTATVSNSYSTGNVSGNTFVGGLLGHNEAFSGTATVNNSFWNLATSGQAQAGFNSNYSVLNNVAGLSNSQIRQLGSFASWGSDIDAQGGTGSVWRIYDGYTTPLLRSFLTDISVDIANTSRTYDGTAHSGGTGYTVSDSDATLLGSFAYAGSAQGARHAGSYHISSSGLYSSQQGYDIRVNDGTLAINKENLILTSTDVSKTYDGSTSAAGNAVVSSGQLFDTDSISGGTFAFDTKHAGTGKHVSVSGVVVNDGNNGDNYNVSYADNTSSVINKANLILTSTDVTKTYDGSTSAAGNAVVGSGQLFDTDSISGGTFAFDNKNAGTGKHVSVSGVVVNDGNNGDNYNVSYADNISSTINKRLLTISAVADSKPYDGKLNSTGKPVVITGRQRGDSIVSLTQAFTDKNAGTGKTLRVNNYVIRDANNGNNYDVVLVDNHAGVISPKLLTISTVANSKVYDGGVTAANKPMVSGLVAGDRITGLFQQYEDRYVGENKRLLIRSGYVLQDGNGGQNYVLTEQTSTNGVITAAP